MLWCSCCKTSYNSAVQYNMNMLLFCMIRCFSTLCGSAICRTKCAAALQCAVSSIELRQTCSLVFLFVSVLMTQCNWLVYNRGPYCKIVRCAALCTTVLHYTALLCFTLRSTAYAGLQYIVLQPEGICCSLTALPCNRQDYPPIN